MKMTDEFYSCSNCGALNEGVYTKKIITKDFSDEDFDKIEEKLKYGLQKGEVINDDEISIIEELGIDVEYYEAEYCMICDEEYKGYINTYIED